MAEDKLGPEDFIDTYNAELEAARNVEPRGLEEFPNSDRMTEMLNALSKPAKLSVFVKLFHGKTPKQIKEEVDVSGSTVHNYVNQMEAADLVKHNSGEYGLTWQGEFVLALLENLSMVLKIEQFESLLEGGLEAPSIDEEFFSGGISEGSEVE